MKDIANISQSLCSHSEIRKINMAENIERRVDAAFQKSHEKGYGTRYAYWDAGVRFATHCADVFGLKTIRNMDIRHIQSYINSLLDDDRTNQYQQVSGKEEINIDE